MTKLEHLSKAGPWDLLAWKSNYTQYKVWGEIANPFLNFNEF